MSSRWLAGALVLAGAGTAAADPRVDLDRCEALDRNAVRKAVDAELAGLAADKLAAVGDRAVVVACPDAVTAHLQLEPAPASGPIARSLDLGEVPGELRPRLVALAVVEVVEVAALIGAGAIEPPAPVEPSAPPPDKASGIDPSPLGDTPPPRVIVTPAGFAGDGPGGPGALPGGQGDGPVDTGRRLASRRALGDGGHWLAGRGYTPRAGVRVYPGNAVPMIAAGFEVTFGVISVGVTGAFGQTDDPLGTVRPYLVAATGGVTVACGRQGKLEACASGRVTAGLAGVTASATDAANTTGNDATAPYLEVGGQLELAWRGRERAGVLAVDAGWAEGLVANAGMREAARLDGAVLTTTIGVRW
jgi:hypothetical protein